MARYSIEDTTLTDIANAIRTKKGKTDSIQVADMADEINGISGESSNTITTCTVIIKNNTDDDFSNLHYVTFDGSNKILSGNTLVVYSGSSIVLRNVIVGSILVFEEYSSTYSSSVQTAIGCKYIRYSHHKGVHAFYIGGGVDECSISLI